MPMAYPDDSLARVSLDRIMKEASLCDLRFKKMPDVEPDALRFTKSARDKDGRLYDSRKGLASYYRYGPRNISEMCNVVDRKDPTNNITIELPKIHCSVFERIKAGAHSRSAVVNQLVAPGQGQVRSILLVVSRIQHRLDAVFSAFSAKLQDVMSPVPMREMFRLKRYRLGKA